MKYWALELAAFGRSAATAEQRPSEGWPRSERLAKTDWQEGSPRLRKPLSALVDGQLRGHGGGTAGGGELARLGG
jgi:hypothetical protein